MTNRTRRWIKQLVPPILWKAAGTLLAAQAVSFSGRYASWAEAARHASGYDTDLILQKVKDASLKVKQGRAAFERDSVAFDKMRHSFPVLAGLLHAALANKGTLTVLDFGGALGSSYYQSRGFLSGIKSLQWAVIEQKRFVLCGKESFENAELKFYDDIDECLRRQLPDVALFSSSIQYIGEPYALMRKIADRGIGTIVFDRTPFSFTGDEFITVQKVSPKIYDASYPSWIFSIEKFQRAFASSHSLLADFDADEGVIDSGGITARYKGFIFSRLEPTGRNA